MAQWIHFERAERTHPTWLSTINERSLRRISAWLLLYCLLQAELGVAWDIQWHYLVGRDRFWTPPHITIYIAVAMAGCIALAVVLCETLRHHYGLFERRKDDTIRILHYFYAPSGFVIMGVGPLIAAIAAPFDNYWHLLYGIDITLWSPFHLMGAIGGLIGIIGLAFIFASEAAVAHQQKEQSRQWLGYTALEWGGLMVLASLISLILSALTQFTAITAGQLHILTFPLPLAFIGAFCLMAAAHFTRKPGSATMTTLLLMAYKSLSEIFVPSAMRTLVTHMGLVYRAGRLPTLNTTTILLTGLFVIEALIIDGFMYWQQRHGAIKYDTLILAVIIAVLSVTIPPCVATVVNHFKPLTPDFVSVLQPSWPDLLLVAPLTLVVSLIAVKWGKRLGAFWH